MYWFSVNCWALLPSDNVIVMSVSVGIYFKKKKERSVQFLASRIWIV